MIFSSIPEAEPQLKPYPPRPQPREGLYKRCRLTATVRDTAAARRSQTGERTAAEREIEWTGAAAHQITLPIESRSHVEGLRDGATGATTIETDSCCTLDILGRFCDHEVARRKHRPAACAANLHGGKRLCHWPQG